MMKTLKKNKQTILLILLFWFLATVVRVIAVSNANFPYWFDLGRDAIISRQIIENKDIKIQGPSASGTNDTVFHGVLYYYIIGPAYTIFSGDPQMVMYLMIGLSSLTIIPFYLLTKSISKSNHVATLASILYIFSFEFFKGATWLSNPIISVVSLPFFYYFYWLVFFEKRRNFFVPLLFALALTHQSVILFAPWWGLMIIGFLVEFHDKTLKKWKLSQIFAGFLVYLLTVSTMILAQFKIFKAGLLDLSVLSDNSAWTQDDSLKIVIGTLNQYLLKISNSFFPSLPILSILITIFLLYFIRNKYSTKVKVFLVILLSSPLWLLSWQYRYAYHSFITLELVGILVLSLFIKYLWKLKVGKIIASIIVFLFIFSNISSYKQYNESVSSEYFVPQGAYLRELQSSIDYTYEQANGEEFSISTITNPYGYNSLWSYLYSWYGQEKYGYVPYWYGPNQEGIFGGDLLERSQDPKEIHFSIREPNEGMPIWLYNSFNAEQESIAPSTTEMFGTIELRDHTK